MRNGITLVVIGIIVVVLGFFTYKYYQKNKATPAATPQVTTQPKAGSDIIVPLTMQNGSNEDGQAVLSEVNGKVRVKITLNNQPDGVSQPAHIHVGNCPTPDAVKYPLLNVESGTSTTQLDATLNDLIKNVPLAINVHKSTNDIKTYVSCGNITFEPQL